METSTSSIDTLPDCCHQLFEKYDVDISFLGGEIEKFKNSSQSFLEIKGDFRNIVLFKVDTQFVIPQSIINSEIVILEGQVDCKVLNQQEGKWEKVLQVSAKKGGVIFQPKNSQLVLNKFKSEKSVIALYIGDESIDELNNPERQHFLHPNLPEGLGFSTHEIVLFLPRPSDIEANQMICSYYDEQADIYYQTDQQVEHRKNYKKAINQIIANDLKESKPNMERMLAVACGSGDRAMCIRDHAKMDYHITGVDTSPAMCRQAQKGNVEIFQADLSESAVPTDDMFEASTFLYAFGHVPSRKGRLNILRNIKNALADNGYFYMDVFNLEDTDEWGPHICSLHKKWQLEEQGYELGNVFYQRINGNAAAFLHYFREDEIIELLDTAGFKIGDIWRIDYCQNPGDILPMDDNRGNWLVKAIKK